VANVARFANMMESLWMQKIVCSYAGKSVAKREKKSCLHAGVSAATVDRLVKCWGARG
jgi:hypothetical protein